MSPTPVLDRYRVELIHEPALVRVLAILYLQGAQDEASLGEHSPNKLVDLKRNLDKLFRANLLRLNSDGRWSLTEFAEEILGRSGISLAIAASLIKQQNMESHHESFLNAFLEAKVSQSPNAMRRWIANLKGASFVIERSKTRNVRPLLYYSLLTSDDPDLEYLSGKNYVQSVYRWHREHDTKLWHDNKANLESNENDITQQIEEAYQLTSPKALTVFFFGHGSHNHVPYSRANGPAKEDAAYYNIWARTLSSLYTKAPDTILISACRAGYTTTSEILKKLRSWRATLDDETYDFLVDSALVEAKNPLDEQAKRQIIDRMLGGYNDPRGRISSSMLKAMSASQDVASSSHNLIETLTLLRKAVSESSFEPISKTEANIAVELAHNLAAELKSKIGNP